MQIVKFIFSISFLIFFCGNYLFAQDRLYRKRPKLKTVATTVNSYNTTRQTYKVKPKPFAYVKIKSDLEGIIWFDRDSFDIKAGEIKYFPIFPNSVYYFKKPKQKEGDITYYTNIKTFEKIKGYQDDLRGDTLSGAEYDILILDQYLAFLRNEKRADLDDAIMKMLQMDFVGLPISAQDYQKFSNIQIGKYEVTVAEYSLFQRKIASEEQEKTSNGSQSVGSQVVDISRTNTYTRKFKTGIDWQYDAVGKKIRQKDISWHPVVNVNWEEAVGFCEWLSDQDLNFNYRLPTRKEWIYFAQGGAYENQFPWGNESSGYAHFANFRDTSIFFKLNITSEVEPYNDGYPFTSKVGRFAANGFGIYDMAGNVAEWLADELPKKFIPYKYKDEPIVQQHIGGSYFTLAKHADLKLKTSSGLPSNIRNSGIGFRIVKEPKRVDNINQDLDKRN